MDKQELRSLSKSDLIRIILAQERQNSDLENRIVELERRLLAYENAHTPPSLSKKKRERRPPKGRLGAPEGHPRYERAQPEPTTTDEHKEEACPHCAARLGAPYRVERRIIEDLPAPQPLIVTEHLIDHYRCPSCRRHVIAKHPLGKGVFGPAVQAHVTLLKYDDRLPLRKAVNALGRHYNLPLTNVAVMNLTEQVSQALQPEYQASIKRVRASKIVNADETSIKVDGFNYWIWTFVTKTDTVFVIKPSRGASAVQEVLGDDYQGIVGCDGWKVYLRFSRLQRCWAHLLREGKHLAEHHPILAWLPGALKALFEKITALRKHPPPIAQRWRARDTLTKQLQAILKKVARCKTASKFVTKVTNGMDHWFTCVVYTEVEPTNNAAERALRELVVQRKIIGGLRRPKGAATMECIMTLLTTWRQQGLDLFSTLKSHLAAR